MTFAKIALLDFEQAPPEVERSPKLALQGIVSTVSESFTFDQKSQLQLFGYQRVDSPPCT